MFSHRQPFTDVICCPRRGDKEAASGRDISPTTGRQKHGGGGGGGGELAVDVGEMKTAASGRKWNQCVTKVRGEMLPHDQNLIKQPNPEEKRHRRAEKTWNSSRSLKASSTAILDWNSQSRLFVLPPADSNTKTGASVDGGTRERHLQRPMLQEHLHSC